MIDREESVTGVRFTVISGPTELRSVQEYELAFARRALGKLKSRLGADGLRKLLAPDIEESDARWSRWLAESAGAFRPAMTVIHVSGLTASEFAAYFDSIRDDEPRLLDGHPEHFVVIRTSDGFDVIENLGRWVSQRYVHFTTEDDAVDELLPDFPIRMVGFTTGPDGEVNAHLLHQMRETSDGFEARLSLYLPASTPDDVFEEHRQHLAVEFANWTAVAAHELGRDCVIA
jgi:hypothetical protein